MTCIRLALVLCACIAASPAAAEDKLGRLFFTAAQRAALDAGKQINLAKKGKRAPTIKTPGKIKLNGVVVRSDGERTVWVNNRAYQGRRNPTGLRVSPSTQEPAIADIQIRGDRKPVKLRVGQTYRRASGDITETFESSAEPAKTPKSPDVPPKVPDN